MKSQNTIEELEQEIDRLHDIINTILSRADKALGYELDVEDLEI